MKILITHKEKKLILTQLSQNYIKLSFKYSFTTPLTFLRLYMFLIPISLLQCQIVAALLQVYSTIMN